MRLTVRMGVLFFIASSLMLIGSPTTGFCETTAKPQALEHKMAADGLLRKGLSSQAIVEYQKALELDPSSTATCFNLAIAYYAERNIKGARLALEKLVALDPKDVEAQYNLACLSLCEKDVEKALLHLECAKNYCPMDSGFTPFIQNAFLFIEELKSMDGRTRETVFLLLQQGLPLLSQI